MGWSGGTYTKGNAGTGGWAGDAALGIGIEATRHDTQDNDFATGINQCLNKDGSNSATGNLNLGGYLPTNVGAGTAAAPAFCPGNDVNTGMYSVSADNLGFATNGVRRLLIGNTGAHVIEAVNPSNYALQVFNNDTGGAAYGLIVDGARNNFALAVRDNTNVYRHQFNANGSLNIGAVGAATAAIQVDTSGQPSFVTNSTVRLQVDTSGNLLINKTAINQTGPGTYFNKGTATDQASMYAVKTTSGTVSTLLNWHNGTYVGGVDMSNTATSFPTSSDYRLKENVVPMTGALTKLNQLKPCTFNFIAEPTETITGFLAHEVAAVVPNAVGGEKDAINADGSIKTQTLDHSKLVPLLTGALQELAAKVEALETQLEAVTAI